MSDESFNLGVSYAAGKFGLTAQDIMTKQAANNIIDNSIEKQQLYSTVGCYILKEAGMEDSIEYKVLEKCASYPRLLNKTAYNQLVRPVENVFVKKAGIDLKDVVGGTLNIAGDAAATLFLSSLAIGGAAGAGVWGIQKAVSDEEAETSAKFHQARKYRQMAREIKDEMRLYRKQNRRSNINERGQVVNTPHTSNSAMNYQF